MSTPIKKKQCQGHLFLLPSPLLPPTTRKENISQLNKSSKRTQKNKKIKVETATESSRGVKEINEGAKKDFT